MSRRTSPSNSSAAVVAERYALVRELGVDGDTIQWEAFDRALDRAVLIQLLRPELAHDSASTDRFRALARAAAGGSAACGERWLDAGTDPANGVLFVVREVRSDALPQAVRA